MRLIRARTSLRTAEPAIDLAGADVFDDLVGPSVDQPDLDAGIFAPKISDRARHDSCSKQRRCRNDHTPTLSLCQLVRVTRRRFQIFDDFRRDIVEFNAAFGQFHPARGAIEEPDAKFGFQVARLAGLTSEAMFGLEKRRRKARPFPLRLKERLPLPQRDRMAYLGQPAVCRNPSVLSGQYLCPGRSPIATGQDVVRCRCGQASGWPQCERRGRGSAVVPALGDPRISSALTCSRTALSVDATLADRRLTRQALLSSYSSTSWWGPLPAATIAVLKSTEPCVAFVADAMASIERVGGNPQMRRTID
ncbi:hypothetical protein V1282_003386 [Nitrobacteraceae bacterium AZCC 2146]